MELLTHEQTLELIALAKKGDEAAKKHLYCETKRL